MKSIYLVLILFVISLSPQLLQGQTLNRTSIKFKDKSGRTLKYPQVGGLNSPQFNGVDLNNDGQEDLVIFDRKGNVLMPFLYNGTDYDYAPNYVSNFPVVRHFMLTYDYNCDGIKDLFCYPIGYPVDGLEVYQGSYDNNNQIVFTQIIFPGYYCSPQLGILCNVLNHPGFGGNPTNIQVLKIDIPALDDIDGDGDMDVVTFNASGGYMNYYENQSQDLGYGCDSLIFEHKSNCWGRAYEPGSGINLDFSPRIDSCPYKNYFNDGGRIVSGGASIRHTGSTLTTVDMDNDGDKELIIGDISYPDLTLSTNTGNPDTAWLTSQDLNFPSNSVHASVRDFPAAYLLDIDNDGDRDFVAARNENSDASENYFVASYYENTGTEQLPVYNFMQDDFFVDEMVDYGTFSMPAFFDYNNDSLQDLVIGSLGLFESGGIQKGVLALYENVGSLDTPIYSLITEDYLNASTLNTRRLAPGFGDVDNDGDIDMLLGEEYGTLFFYENTAGAGNPVVFAAPVTNYQGIDVGQASIPQIIDIDRDGKNDLVIGQNQGFLNYFKNTSTSNTPTFTIQPAPNNTLNAWGDVDARPVGYSTGFAAHRVIEVNGQYELFVGNIDGKLMHYQDIETTATGSFTLVTDNYSNLDVGINATLDIKDINNDGELDFAVGNGRGGITIFSQGTIINTIEIKQQEKEIATIFPNPAQATLNIELNDEFIGKLYHVTIYNALGQVIYTEKEVSNNLHQITVSDWNAGVYFVQVNSEGYISAKSVVVTH